MSQFKPKHSKRKPPRSVVGARTIRFPDGKICHVTVIVTDKENKLFVVADAEWFNGDPSDEEKNQVAEIMEQFMTQYFPGIESELHSITIEDDKERERVTDSVLRGEKWK